MIKAMVPPAGHSSEVLWAPDIVISPAQLTARKVQTRSAATIGAIRSSRLQPT
jgi:hypothetical protein